MLYEVNQLRLPPNPDPRTGLLRLDLLWRVGDYGKWWLSGPKTAIAWHRLKSEEVSQRPRKWSEREECSARGTLGYDERGRELEGASGGTARRNEGGAR